MIKESKLKKTASNISSNMTVSNPSDKTKITIRDLCPEEKAKIGDLLKKLAEENEEKEKLKQVIEDDKKNYESKIDSIMKVKDILSTSGFNNSINLRSESFMDNLIPQNCEKLGLISKDPPKIDMKNLRDKFNKVFNNLKKTAQNQKDYFTKYSNNTNGNNNNNIYNESLSILREEKPLTLDCKPTPRENDMSNRTLKNFTINFDKFDNLQTSILNINEEIKENINQDLFSDSILINNYIYRIFRMG